jgi:hypothetical protein
LSLAVIANAINNALTHRMFAERERQPSSVTVKMEIGYALCSIILLALEEPNVATPSKSYMTKNQNQT